MDSIKLIEIAAIVLALMIAIIGHEIMHGYVAYRYGDDTAKHMGRLSVNPFVHVDLVGTIIVPAVLFLSNAPFMFGWAKPVPIYMPSVIRNGGYKAAIAVSLAGIAYNFTLAILASVVLSQLGDISEVNSYVEYFWVYFLVQSMIYNVVLGIFNLYPIPPLDGSHALSYLGRIFGWNALVRFYESTERYGMIILIVCIATPLSSYFFMPIRVVLSWLY
ncbi:MAG TPA: site-2 protease family protein [Sulfurospirillum cavolei]|uniref:Site-2 protease family protein n=1 Tax=Sulfurospirillum cavolei TaxID=366522 RepID=A0A2D3WCB1_9BACT|nr:MAG TPA: site-2 protease family protein [Sulfurospirillum cavolei]